MVACSGPEIINGTLSRAVARIIFEKKCPHKTIIFCQGLFKAGGLERHGNERDFVKKHPTITIEGCNKQCAKIAIENYSGPVSATFNIEDFIKKYPKLKLGSKEHLNENGNLFVEKIADIVSKKVNDLFKNQ
ncbi:MAG: putative zinc-binding protein [Candidatus Helarchaeota archaeon]